VVLSIASQRERKAKGSFVAKVLPKYQKDDIFSGFFQLKFKEV
jgi:hypothetical protein